MNDFLRKYELVADTFSLFENSEKFKQEMHGGLVGSESSLLMIPTYLSAEGNVPINKRVIVMDAGGTNFRVATVTFNEARKPVIEHFNKYPMPGSQGEITKEEFLSRIADYLLPVIDQSDKIGFCFSFPSQITEDRDGLLLQFCKEVKVKGAEGMKICTEIAEALKAKGVKEEKHFVLLNDTVATLLGGISAESGQAFDSYIGFILGTGTNACYVEKCENIVKDAAIRKQSGQMIINIESGVYRGVKQGYIDLELDRASENPGDHIYEKMISGAYQGKILYLALKQAITDGLFSRQFAKRFEDITDISTYQIDEFCCSPYGNGVLAGCTVGNEDDCQTLYGIIDAIIERAACLVAIQLGAILTKTGKGRLPTRPVCVTAEGTTFYKSKLLRPKLDYYVRTFINEQLGYYCEFMKEENVTLTGTAVAVLLNL